MTARPTLVCLVLLTSQATADPLPPPASQRIDFVKDIQPLLANACYSCHGPDKQRGNLRLDRRASFLDAGVIVAGKSADSLLIKLVAGLDADRVMPPKGPKLTPKQVAIFRAWIDQGADWPASADALDSGKDHWAYQPLKKPSVPRVQRQEWVRTPIDAFVLARLEAHKMTPTAEADRRTLLRRLTFDLTGLPPTPEEMKSFLEDKRADAYERVVDRLLASPRYGERWARHWMDAVHYAETHGHDQDAPRENAWPYRDYLIRAFNDDKPYGRFVEEQVAGDVLYPNEPQATVATGFLATGPWDESSQKDINGDTLDKKIAQYLDRDDMVSTTMATFVGATVHCARCHDHKFDPISMGDYYGLQAVFAGVDRANRPYEADPKAARARRELNARRAEVLAVGSLLQSAETQTEVDRWEKALTVRPQVWDVLTAEVTSAGGATVTKLDDGSFLFGGKRADKDTYTITARVASGKLTGFRVEVLPHDSLPHKGPGRQDNGNLHLSEIRVKAADADAALAGAVADYDQPGWTIAHALDGKPQTAWGIYPEVGKPHAGYVTFKSPLDCTGGKTLTFTLDQLHGGGHLIGRLRLSVTTAVPPFLPEALPDAVARIVATPAAKRSDAQKTELARYVLLGRIDRELSALPAPPLVYAAAPDFTPLGNFKPAKGARPIHVLKRGDIRNPGAAAVPGALNMVPGLSGAFKLDRPDDEGARRAALAKWLSDPKNVLTWRSIVNRVWHHHFGRGIVASPNDFGRMGARPTHPELLDWLALWLLEHDGSLKNLHRLLVTSNVYRQAATHREDYARDDGDNLLLWRMNRSRLDAECVRDAVLHASGKLDLKMGGPSVKQFIQKPGIHVTPLVDYENFDVDSPAMHRRSVYRFVFRTLPDPFMDTLDCADASQLTPVRHNSVTALHALAMLNDRFLVRQSEHFAARLEKEDPDVGEQVKRAYELALSRPATKKEVELLAAHAKKHGLANVCRLIFNLNEFMFVP